MLRRIAPSPVLLLDLGADVAKMIGGVILDAIFGLFGLLADMVQATVGPKIASLYIATIFQTPTPMRGSSIAIIQQPTNQWASVYTNYYQYFLAGIFIGLLVYVLVNFIGSIPYTSVQRSDNIRGGLLKYFAMSVFGLPVIFFTVHFVDGLIKLFAPSKPAINALISQTIAAMAAASASPFAILTTVASFVSIGVFVLTVALYWARLLIIQALPMFAPLIWVGYCMEVPVIKQYSVAMMRGWVKLLIAPIFVAIVLKVGTAILMVKKTTGGSGGNASAAAGKAAAAAASGAPSAATVTWELKSTGPLINQIAYFALALVIPGIAIVGLLFALMVSMPTAVSRPMSIGAMAFGHKPVTDAVGSGDKKKQNSDDGTESKWERVTTAENWGYNGALTRGAKGMTHPIRTGRKAVQAVRSETVEQARDADQWAGSKVDGVEKEVSDFKDTWEGWTAKNTPGPEKLPADMWGQMTPDDHLPDNLRSMDIEEMGPTEKLMTTEALIERISDKNLDEVDEEFAALGQLIASGPQPIDDGVSMIQEQFDQSPSAVSATLAGAQSDINLSELNKDLSETDKGFEEFLADSSGGHSAQYLTRGPGRPGKQLEEAKQKGEVPDEWQDLFPRDSAYEKTPIGMPERISPSGEISDEVIENIDSNSVEDMNKSGKIQHIAALTESLSGKQLNEVENEFAALGTLLADADHNPRRALEGIQAQFRHETPEAVTAAFIQAQDNLRQEDLNEIYSQGANTDDSYISRGPGSPGKEQQDADRDGRETESWEDAFPSESDPFTETAIGGPTSPLGESAEVSDSLLEDLEMLDVDQMQESDKRAAIDALTDRLGTKSLDEADEEFAALGPLLADSDHSTTRGLVPIQEQFDASPSTVTQRFARAQDDLDREDMIAIHAARSEHPSGPAATNRAREVAKARYATDIAEDLASQMNEQTLVEPLGNGNDASDADENQKAARFESLAQQVSDKELHNSLDEVGEMGTLLADSELDMIPGINRIHDQFPDADPDEIHLALSDSSRDDAFQVESTGKHGFELLDGETGKPIFTTGTGDPARSVSDTDEEQSSSPIGTSAPGENGAEESAESETVRRPSRDDIRSDASILPDQVTYEPGGVEISAEGTNSDTAGLDQLAESLRSLSSVDSPSEVTLDRDTIDEELAQALSVARHEQVEDEVPIGQDGPDILSNLDATSLSTDQNDSRVRIEFDTASRSSGVGTGSQISGSSKNGSNGSAPNPDANGNLSDGPNNEVVNGGNGTAAEELASEQPVPPDQPADHSVEQNSAGQPIPPDEPADHSVEDDNSSSQ